MTETVALMRIRDKDAPPDVATYAAVRAAEALEVAAGQAADGGQAEVVPWEVIPHARAHIERDLDARPPRSVLLLGTTEAGRWATWHMPFPAPPVPLR